MIPMRKPDPLEENTDWDMTKRNPTDASLKELSDILRQGMVVTGVGKGAQGYDVQMMKEITTFKGGESEVGEFTPWLRKFQSAITMVSYYINDELCCMYPEAKLERTASKTFLSLSSEVQKNYFEVVYALWHHFNRTPRYHLPARCTQ